MNVNWVDDWVFQWLLAPWRGTKGPLGRLVFWWDVRMMKRFLDALRKVS